MKKERKNIKRLRKLIKEYYRCYLSMYLFIGMGIAFLITDIFLNCKVGIIISISGVLILIFLILVHLKEKEIRKMVKMDKKTKIYEIDINK